MKTAISFDEWWEENYMMVSTDRTEAEDIYNLGQQSQLTKIGELQARIDGALNMLCKLQYSSGERIYNDVGNILKGREDEN